MAVFKSNDLSQDQTRGGEYRPDIDGLRALAVLPVLLFHADLGCPGGFVGVDVFFVISGYLICSLILRELDEGTFSLAAFWERRVRRILPALVLVVFSAIIAGWFLLFPGDFQKFGKSVIAQATLLSNVFFYRQGLMGGGYFTEGSDTKTLLHTWSLAVEEQFYLLFPLLLLFLARQPRRSLFKIVLASAVLSFGLAVFASYKYQSAAFYLLPMRGWELMVGALLSMMPEQRAVNSSTREISGWTGLGLILFAVFFYSKDTRFPGLTALPPCLGAALIIFSSQLEPSFVGRILSLQPVVFIGLISYSLYLWHWPLLTFANYLSVDDESAGARAGLLVASGALAVLSWKFVETPFRKRRIFKRRSQIFGFAAVTTAALLLCGLGILHFQGIPARFHGRGLALLKSRSHERHAPQGIWEVNLEQAQAGRFLELVSDRTNQPANLLVWGDSHAVRLAPVLEALCRKYGWRGVQATHGVTPPVFGFVSTNAYSLREDAPAYSRAVADYIAQRHVGSVVLAARWAIYPATDAFKSNLLSTVRAVLDTGARVYVLKDVPTQRKDMNRITALAVVRTGILDHMGVTREQHQKLNADYAGVFDQISRMGAIVLDPADYLLNADGNYGVVKNDQILYSDGDHLTMDGAMLLTPLFEPIFQPGPKDPNDESRSVIRTGGHPDGGDAAGPTGAGRSKGGN